jgi:hypothetical protein
LSIDQEFAEKTTFARSALRTTALAGAAKNIAEVSEAIQEFRGDCSEAARPAKEPARCHATLHAARKTSAQETVGSEDLRNLLAADKRR